MSRRLQTIFLPAATGALVIAAWYAVHALRQDEIVEIFELRVVIEEHAARVAALARTEDDIDVVTGLVAGGTVGTWLTLHTHSMDGILRPALLLNVLNTVRGR